MTLGLCLLGTIMIATSAITAFAAETTTPAAAEATTLYSGVCGTGVYWEYFEDTHTLYIHGNGTITSSPWSSYKAKIKKIIIGNEITSICQGAFYGCSQLEEITLPFIGESKNATGYKGVLGYIFGNESTFFADGSESAYGNYGNHTYEVNVGATVSVSGYHFYDDKQSQVCDVHRQFLHGRDLKYADMYRIYQDENFVNCQISMDLFMLRIPESTTWQYSAYTYDSFVYYDYASASVGYIKRTGFSLQSYFYYIPKSLAIVNIKNTTRIPEAAFNGCSNLETINIYSGITSEGEYSYQNCNASVNYINNADSDNHTYTNDLDTFTYCVQNGNATIISCETSNEAITIPSSIEGYPVTTIGYNAFANNTQIKSIILPTTVTKVDSYAFYNCKNLENITLGTSLAEIGDYAFYNTALTKITTPASLRTIGNYAFANCSALTKFTMRSGVENLGDGVFYNAIQLSDVTLSNTIDAISDFCFYNCSSLTEINIPASVIKIENCAFEKCTNLIAATIEGNVEYIGKKAFYSCNLSSFDFGNKLTYLGTDSFSLNPITTADLPNTVTQIGAQAFSDCQLLSNLYVPDSVTLGANALYNNASNLKVTIRYNTGTIPDKMLYKNKMSFVVMEDGITDIGEYAFAECTDLKGIIFPKTLKNIGNFAFYKSKLSADITLPQKVTTIGNNAFSGVTELTEISVPDSIQTIGTRAFDSNVSVSIYYRLGEICNDLFNGQLVKGIFVDDEIYSIGDNAFANCMNLVELSLPDTISTVGSGCFAFSHNTVLTIRTVDGKIDNEVFRGKLSAISTVNLDNSNIGDYAFADNSNLKNVTISATSEIATITSIGDHAFEGCTTLNQLVLPATLKSIGSHAFYECISLNSVNIPDGVTDIRSNTFYNCSSLASITLPQTIASVGEYAFYGCADMVSINIPSGVETIPDYAFYGCGSLETIDIPDTVTDIGNYSFYGCIVLLSAEISNQCVSIGDYAFYNCKTLSSLVLPDSLKSIGDYAFASCIKLTNITLGDTIESLGESVFYNCTGLSSISFGKGITALPRQAIGGCYNLESVYIYAPLSYIDTLAFYGADFVTVYCGRDDYMINFFDENGIMYEILDGLVYQYKITFVTDNGEIISSGTYDSGSTITAPINPTKAADKTYTYVFAGWDQEVTVVGGNKTYTASFTSVYIEYTVVFKDHNGNALSTKTYHYGDEVTTPSDPTKAADNTYTYAFTGWNKEVVACEGDTTYTATYTSTYIEYTVEFKDFGGEIISSNIYHYGDAIIVPANPTRAADLLGTYSFKGWDKAVVPCAGNATYTATYDITYIDYTVTFKNYDGSTISTKTYHYGDTVTVPSTPTKAADATYTYVFAGWNNTVTVCEGNAEYVATFTPEYIEYTVVFKNYDDTVISTKTYHYGQSVTAPTNPTKPSDVRYSYTFAGWDTPVTACAGDATYKATYSSEYIDYTITFVDYNGTVLGTKTYHYGETIEAIDDPTKAADNTYTYAFAGWDKELGICEGNETFTATYTPAYVEYKVVFKNHDGTTITEVNYHYGATVVEPSTIPTKLSDNTYTYTFIGWDKSVTTCKGDTVYTATFTPVYINYTITFKNDNGSILSTQTYHYGETITQPTTPTKASDKVYSYSFKTWDKAVVKCEGDATYTATYTPTYIEYTVKFVDEDNTPISTRTYHYGDTIVAPTNPTKASDNTYNYTFAGWDKAVTNCDGDTTYKATYTSAYINYTVVFKNYNDDVISSKTYHYGDAVVVPVTPKKPSDENYCYVFVGWDKSVTNCFGDAVYTAKFTASDLPIVTVNNSSARANETVVVNILLSGAPNLGSLAISNILYDTSAFELVSVDWKVADAILSNWDAATGKGALALSTAKDINGTIISLTFKVKAGTADGNYPVSCTVTSQECDFKNVAGQLTVYSVTPGDVDGNESVDKDDAIYLLMHSFFPEDYPINQEADYNGNGMVDKDDAIHLLMYTFFPDDYPLAPAPAAVTITTTVERKKGDEDEE